MEYREVIIYEDEGKLVPPEGMLFSDGKRYHLKKHDIVKLPAYEASRIVASDGASYMAEPDPQILATWGPPRFDPIISPIVELVREAKAAAGFRGHDMGDWTHHGTPEISDVYISECRKCKKWVQVKPKPAPNEIDIGGPAVALNCNDLEKS